MRGGNLRSELLEFSEAPHVTREKYWNSVDRRSFYQVQGKAKVIRAVEGFAKVVLLEDPFKSEFQLCDKCEGVVLQREVVDSIHDMGPLQGTGKTKRRVVSYCPDCEPEPRGQIIHDESFDIL
jgi:hypothetical protein